MGGEAIQHAYRILSTKAKCLANVEEVPTIFERPLDDISAEEIAVYSYRDAEKLTDSVMRYIDNYDPKFKSFKKPLH